MSSWLDFVELNPAWWLSWGLLGLAILVWILASKDKLESGDKKTLAAVLALALVFVLVCHQYIVTKKPDSEGPPTETAQPEPLVPGGSV